MTQYEKILERLDRQDAEMAAITQGMLTLRQALEDRLQLVLDLLHKGGLFDSEADAQRYADELNRTEEV